MYKQHPVLSTFLLAVFTCVVLASCKKYIYEEPIDSTYSAKFWTSQVSAEQATLAMYGQLRASLRQDRSYFIFGDLASGDFETGTSWWNYATISATGNFNFSYVPYLEGSLQNWSRFYQVIAQCNLILQNVTAMPDNLFSSKEVKNAYLGEALFMRAYSYFYMTRVWGDPVYVTKTYDDADYGNIPPLARTPESLVLDSCIADLSTAANYLGYANGNSSASIRANKGSVEALLAHIYAWKHDYAKAHAACQDVIDNGGYALEGMDTYTNIWKGQSSSENIFELSMTYNPSDPNFKGQGAWAEAQFDFFGTTFLKGTLVNNQNNSSWVSPYGGFVDQFFDTSADARFHAVFSQVPASNGDKAGYMMLKYADFNYDDPEKELYPYINNNLVLFRLSDIILLNAEALAATGDLEGARTNLALTETRAGITSYENPQSQYDMMDEIVIERGRELVGEGQWYYDLVRTNQTQGWLEYEGYASDRVQPQNKGYYWPLDMSTLFPQDNLLTQNPWWATHK